MKHYQGELFKMPSENYILQVLSELCKYTDLTYCFTLDVGVLADGSTQVVEMNDAWSIGTYGLDGEVYLKWLIKRWKQMIENNKYLVDYKRKKDK